MEDKADLHRKIFLAAKAASSFLGTCGLCYLSRLAGVQKASYTVLGILIFLVVWNLLGETVKDLEGIADKKAKRRRIIFSIIVAYLFSLSMIMGYQLQGSGMTECGVKGKGLILFRSAWLAIAIFPAGNLLFKLTERIKPLCDGRPGTRQLRPGIVFGICAAVTFALLIPVWLAYYPIVMSSDFHRQVNEAYKGFIWFYPYQPIAHTWVIWVFMQLGNVLGSLQTGYACMALFQMLLYALVTGYACSILYRILKRVWVMIVAVLYFAVFPFHSVLVVSTTKDVLFSILFLLFFLLLIERSLFATGRKRFLLEILMVLEGCIMAQFRNNAFYAVAVFMVLFFILTPKKEKLRVLLLGVLLIAGCRVTDTVITKAIGTKIKKPKVEMFSVPIQQMARVGYYHENELDDEISALLDSYIPRAIWKNYNPPIADTVKNSVHTEKFSENYGELFSSWAKLGLRYPNEYIDAFLELTRGYWFLDDTSWAENLGYGLEERMGAVSTYNSSEIAGVGSIEHESKLPWLELQLEKIVSANAFYDWPVVSVLFKSAFYIWLLFLVTCAMLYRKRKEQLKLTLFVWLYFGTMILGPVVQIRYVFPIMMCLPVIIAIQFLDEDHSTNQAQERNKA